MIYKTLHWYIFREMARVFLMTASALTTVMAFGGVFNPLTKQGLDLSRLMLVLFNLMPAMLAYAIPMAALFAAVLVYWRLSTDNEVTACRASGISFLSVLFPAFILGMGVASMDLVFVNYVVPTFFKRVERTIRTDLGAMLVTQVTRQEYFQMRGMPVIVYADSGSSKVFRGDEVPEADRKRGVTSQTVVTLQGMSAIVLGRDKPSYLVAARAAKVIFDEDSTRDELSLRVLMQNGAGYQFDTFNKISGEMSSLPPNGVPFPLPSLFKNRPKFLNILQLRTLSQDPYAYPDVQTISDSIRRIWVHQRLAWQIGLLFRSHPGEGVTFRRGAETVQVHAPEIGRDAEGNMFFQAVNGVAVRVDQSLSNSYYTCDRVSVSLNEEDLGLGTGTLTRVGLELTGNVTRHVVDQSNASFASLSIHSLVLPAGVAPPTAAEWEKEKLAIRNDPQKYTPEIQRLMVNLKTAMALLFQSINSEYNGRASFALSCLTLVLLGAGLGIVMRGQNPLLVFVMGLVPAAVVVLLITAGRRMIEDASAGAMFGMCVVWAGNVLLAVIVGVLFWKLLRS